ncbi:MAG: FABP family protein [Nakamurella sp.]
MTNAPHSEDRPDSPEEAVLPAPEDRSHDGDDAEPRPSGDAALAAAIERSLSPQGTTALNIGDTTPLPIASDTANLRLGPGLDDANLSLLPLVGVWRGEGRLHTPDEVPDRVFGQQLTISHDGRGFLRHESILWLLEGDGTALAAEREVGWWRPQPDGVIELVLAHADGVVEVFYGAAQTLASWQLGTDAVVRTTSAPPVTGATRLYGIVDAKLAYVDERATTEHPLRPYASALLERSAG